MGTDIDTTNFEGGRINLIEGDEVPVSSPQPRQDQNRFQCPQCRKAYSRRDHLSRHVISHANERQYKCSSCGKAFARKDLLRRHLQLHESSPVSNSYLKSSFGRVEKACKTCALAKSRCDDVKPCRRCRTRAIDCLPDTSNSSTTAKPVTTARLALVERPASPDVSVPWTDGLLSQYHTTSAARVGSAAEGNPLSMGPDIDHPEILTNNQFPGIFLPMNDTAQLLSLSPKDITLLDQDGGGQSGSVSFDLEPSAALLDDFFSDDIEDGFPLSWCFSTLANRNPEPTTLEKFPSKQMNQTETAFQNSPWLTQGLKSPTVHQSDTGAAASTSDLDLIRHLSRNFWSAVPQRFDQRTRDSLVALMASEGKPCDGPSPHIDFPSLRLLDILLDRFFRKQDQKVDSWIHSAAFSPALTDLDLTSMILAWSALNSHIYSLRRWGSRLCRIIQARLNRRIQCEYDCSTNISLLQALLLSVEVEAWNCDHSCLLQGSSLSGLLNDCLRLSWRTNAGQEDVGATAAWAKSELTESSWQQWVTWESRNRLVARFSILENQRAAALGIRPSLAVDVLRQPLPQPRTLWMARTETEWNKLYTPQSDEATTAEDLLASLMTAPLSEGFFDFAFAYKIIALQLTGSVVGNHLMGSPFKLRAHVHANWKNEIRRVTGNLARTTHALSSLLSGIAISYLSMVTDSSIDDFEVLLGRTGQKASEKMSCVMEPWINTQESRKTIWHAGQILRIFPQINRPLSSFHVVMVYQAGLFLLGYSWLKRRTGSLTRQDLALLPNLCLNGDDITTAEDFFVSGFWEPVLQASTTEGAPPVSLRNPQDVATVVADIILDKTQGSEELSQWLVGGLVQLLKDIAASVPSP